MAQWWRRKNLKADVCESAAQEICHSVDFLFQLGIIELWPRLQHIYTMIVVFPADMKF